MESRKEMKIKTARWLKKRQWNKQERGRRREDKKRAEEEEQEEEEDFPFTLLIGLWGAENLLSPMKC